MTISLDQTGRKVLNNPRRLRGRILEVLIVAGIVSLGLGTASFAQQGLRISGKVIDETGEAVKGAQIVLTPVDQEGQPTSGGVEERVATNKKGKFIFGFAKPGNYVLSVEAEGLQAQLAALKMRSADRKPVYSASGGAIEDLSGAVDPANPTIRLSIPREAFYVTVDLTLAPPRAPTATASSPGAAASQAAVNDLGKEAQDVVDLITIGQFEAAIGRVAKLIEAEPEAAPLHYLRGFSLFRLGRTEEAAAAIEESIRIDPSLAGPSGLHGQILGDLGRYEEAAAALRLELDRTEDLAQRAPLLLSLGQCLLELERPGEAIPALEEAQQANPESTQIKIQLADALIKSGQKDRAEQLLAADLAAEEAAVLHFNLAGALLMDSEYEPAIAHLVRALELDPSLADVHRSLAQAYLGTGAMDEAISAFEAYVAARPEAPDAEDTQKIIDALRSRQKDG